MAAGCWATLALPQTAAHLVADSKRTAAICVADRISKLCTITARDPLNTGKADMAAATIRFGAAGRSVVHAMTRRLRGSLRPLPRLLR